MFPSVRKDKKRINDNNFFIIIFDYLVKFNLIQICQKYNL